MAAIFGLRLMLAPLSFSARSISSAICRTIAYLLGCNLALGNGVFCGRCVFFLKYYAFTA